MVWTLYLLWVVRFGKFFNFVERTVKGTTVFYRSTGFDHFIVSFWV